MEIGHSHAPGIMLRQRSGLRGANIYTAPCPCSGAMHRMMKPVPQHHQAVDLARFARCWWVRWTQCWTQYGALSARKLIIYQSREGRGLGSQ